MWIQEIHCLTFCNPCLSLCFHCPLPGNVIFNLLQKAREIRYPESLNCYQKKVPISIRSRSNSDRQQEGRKLITFEQGRSLPQLSSGALILTSQHKTNRGFIELLRVYYTLQLLLFYRIFCSNSIFTSIVERLTSFFIYQVRYTATCLWFPV